MLNICLSGGGYSEHHFSQLAENNFIVTHKPDFLSPEALQELLPQCDAYVLGGDERLTEEALQSADKLRVISFVGTGYTSFIDEKAARARHIEIRNTPAVMAPAVAEHTVGLLIGLQRRLFQQNWQVKNSCATTCRTEELSSLCVGIIGMGAIGTRVARIMRQAFGSKVIYTSRSQKPAVEAELAIDFVEMDTLLKTADVILLALPTTSETEYFLNDALLSKTKAGVSIINTAGARLIDPVALKKYLENDHIAAVGLDGYYIEPLPNVNEDPFHLLALPDDKLIVSPHTAAKTSQSWNRMVDMAIDNVIQFFR